MYCVVFMTLYYFVCCDNKCQKTSALPYIYAFAAISLRHVRFARMERRTITFIDVFCVIRCCGLSDCRRRKQSDA